MTPFLFAFEIMKISHIFPFSLVDFQILKIEYRQTKYIDVDIVLCSIYKNLRRNFKSPEICRVGINDRNDFWII